MRFGKKLFERSIKGYQRTAFADKIYAEAHHIEECFKKISRDVSGQNKELSGDIRVTFPLVLGEPVLMPIMHQFCQNYPEIELELLATYDTLSLSQRQADVAFRFCQKPDDHLIAKKISSMYRACYVTRNWSEQIQDQKFLESLNWIGWSDRMHRPVGKVAQAYPRFDSKHKIMDIQLQIKACELGMGIAVLPCFLGDANPNLIRIPPYVTESRYDLWLLIHPDLRKNAKIQKFIQYISSEIGQYVPLFEGKKMHHLAEIDGISNEAFA